MRSDPAIRVRDYAPADRDACLAVFDSNLHAFFDPAEREDFAAFLDRRPGPYLVIEDGEGRVVGCGGYAVEPGTATADLCWGMVAREHHRTGLGELLLDLRLRRIRAEPAVRDVALNTSQHTRGFFERFGFVTERVVPDGFGPGLDRCDMRLVLPEKHPVPEPSPGPASRA